MDTMIKVSKYSILSANAVLGKGGKTEVSTILINKNNMTFSPELTIPPNVPEENKPTLTDFTTSPKLLEYDPSKFLNGSISPKPISELFNQYLGALVICVVRNGKDSVIDRIEPRELGTEIKPYFNSIEDKKELYFSNQLDQNIKAAIPGITELKVDFNTTKMYNLKIVYKGIGEIGWKNDNNIDINTNFQNKLSVATHYKLAKYRIKYGDSLRVYQINKAYCYEGIYFQLTEMKQIDQSNIINASIYFFNQGNYKINNKTTIERNIGSGFVGYWSENPLTFTELLDFSLSTYYNQQRNLFLSLPEQEVIKRYKEMFKSDSIVTADLTKEKIINYLGSYVNAYKLRDPILSNNPLLQQAEISIDNNINNLKTSEINLKYDKLNENLDFTLPEDASIETKKRYLSIMQNKQ